MKGLRFLKVPAGIALGASAFILVVDLLLSPLYVRGSGQGVLSHLNGVSFLLALPGTFIAIAAGVREGHHTTQGAWWLVLVANFLILTALLAIVVAISRLPGLFIRRPEADANGQPPAPLVTRRRLLLSGAGVVAAGGIAGYAMSVATRRYEITHRTIPIRGLPPELAGLRIVQLTDIHHGPWIPLPHVRAVVAATNALDADLVLLTGDYVHRSAVYIDPVVAALAGLRARVGVLGVLGNHDWWESASATRKAFTDAHIPLIDNTRRFVTTDRTLAGDAATGLCIAGVGDYYEDQQLYRDALGGVPEAMPRLLLSHNPDVAEDPEFIRSALRVDLMLSGHTHGGQIRIPLLGSPFVPSRYGEKYARGLVQGPACPVFICRGVGHSVLPARFGVAPEVAVLTLQPA